jgi:putative membrane protein insertion efficiency factor
MILSFISFKNCNAQFQEDIKCAKSLFKTEEKINFAEFAKGNKNEIESTFSAVFIFYKKFISSQDIDACVFYPSCSVYAIECIHHEKNKITAFLKISDRVMRCHPLVSPGTYKIDNHTGKFFDPIEN